MNRKDVEVLRAAVKDKRKDETFENALGRAIREEGGDFERYIDLIGRVRDYANLKKTNLVKAAKLLLKESD